MKYKVKVIELSGREYVFSNLQVAKEWIKKEKFLYPFRKYKIVNLKEAN